MMGEMTGKSERMDMYKHVGSTGCPQKHTHTRTHRHTNEREKKKGGGSMMIGRVREQGDMDSRPIDQMDLTWSQTDESE